MIQFQSRESRRIGPVSLVGRKKRLEVELENGTIGKGRTGDPVGAAD